MIRCLCRPCIDNFFKDTAFLVTMCERVFRYSIMNNDKYLIHNDMVSAIMMVVVVFSISTLYLVAVQLIALVDCLKFITAILFLVYVPGYTVLKLVDYSGNLVSGIFLSLLVGASLGPTIYFLTRIIGLPWLFLLVSFLCLIYFIKENKDITLQLLTTMQRHHMEKIWWMGLLVLFILLFLLNYSHFSDWVILADKDYLLRSHPTTESMFHLGIINAIADDLTPTFPYFSGYNLPYHLGMHVFAELLCRFTGISTILMVYYFLPLFYFVLIIAIPAIFFYQLTKNIYFSVLFGFTMFASDLSFLLKMLEISENLPYVNAAIAFASPMWGIFTLNGIMPAIPLFFGAAIAFDSYFKENNRKYLLLFILFVTYSFQVKSSMGPHIIGSAFVSLFALYFINNNKKNRDITVALIISSIMIFYYYYLRSPPTENIQVVEFDFLYGLSRSLGNLKITPFSDQHILLILFYIVVFFVYVIGVFGLKIYFIKNVHDFFTNKITDPTIIFLLSFIVSGFLLSEVLFIGSRESNINNASWFANQSLYAAGFFLIWRISSIASPVKRRLSTLIVILFSFSGTVYFLDVRNSDQYIKIINQQLALADFIKANIPIGAVVIEPSNTYLSSVSHLSGKNSFASIQVTYLKHYAFSADIIERIDIIDGFYDEASKSERRVILLNNNIDYIIINKSSNEFIEKLNLGDKIYENSEYSLIKVRLQPLLDIATSRNI